MDLSARAGKRPRQVHTARCRRWRYAEGASTVVGPHCLGPGCVQPIGYRIHRLLRQKPAPAERRANHVSHFFTLEWGKRRSANE
jgi:hypothetical protein